METVRAWIGAVVFGGNWEFADADGVQQEIVVELLRIARAGQVREPGGFQKFVYTVSKNVCVKHYHREKRRNRHERPESDAQEVAGGADPTRSVEAAERLASLEYVLQRMSGSCRELWDLVYREKLPAAEVADRLAISATNVRVRVHRCAARARQIYRELVSA